MSERICPQVQKLLHGYLDGEVTDPERTRVLEHMASCPACQQAHTDLVVVDQRLRGMTVPPLPADLVRRVMAALPAATTAATRATTAVARATTVWISLGHLALAAAILLVPVIGAVVLRQGWTATGEWLAGQPAHLTTAMTAAGGTLWAWCTSLASWPTLLALRLQEALAVGLVWLQAGTDWLQTGMAWLRDDYGMALAAVGLSGCLTGGLLWLWGREVRAFAEE